MYLFITIKNWRWIEYYSRRNKFESHYL